MRLVASSGDFGAGFFMTPSNLRPQRDVHDLSGRELRLELAVGNLGRPGEERSGDLLQQPDDNQGHAEIRE